MTGFGNNVVEWVKENSWTAEELADAVTAWENGSISLPDGQFAWVANWSAQFAEQIPEGHDPVALIPNVAPDRFAEGGYSLGCAIRVTTPGGGSETHLLEPDEVQQIDVASGLNLHNLRPLSLAGALAVKIAKAKL